MRPFFLISNELWGCSMASDGDEWTVWRAAWGRLQHHIGLHAHTHTAFGAWERHEADRLTDTNTAEQRGGQREERRQGSRHGRRDTEMVVRAQTLILEYSVCVCACLSRWQWVCHVAINLSTIILWCPGWKPQTGVSLTPVHVFLFYGSASWCFTNLFGMFVSISLLFLAVFFFFVYVCVCVFTCLFLLCSSTSMHLYNSLILEGAL